MRVLQKLANTWKSIVTTAHNERERKSKIVDSYISSTQNSFHSSLFFSFLFLSLSRFFSLFVKNLFCTILACIANGLYEMCKTKVET